MVFALGAFPLAAGDQPQWGMRYGRNMASCETGLPGTFDPATGKNVKWSVQLGTETHGTPVVANGRVLIGTNNDNPRDPRYKGDRGVLMCFDEGDGRFCWQLVVPKYSNDPYQDWPHAGICSTPTIEGDRVYVLSNRGEALCLDLNGLADGNDGPFTDEARLMAPRDTDPLPLGPTDPDILWVFDIHAQVGSYPHDAAHSSFLLCGNYLYTNTGNGVDNTHRRIRAPDAPSLIVLDKGTGRLVAQDAEHIGPRIFHSTWSSPALGEVNGQPLVFFGGGDGVVYAFEPVTHESGAGAPLATAADAAASPGSLVSPLRRVWKFDCDPSAPKENVHQYNGNRRVSPSNIKSIPVFHDGRLYVTVGGDLWWGKNEAWLKCIDPSGTGDITATGELWSYALVRHCMASPAIGGSLAFAGDCGRTLHCVDLATGQGVWSHRVDGEIWASPFVADGRVYVATRGGTLWVFAAEREKRILAEIDLGSPISATPMAANGVLYLATMNRLLAVASTP